MPDIFSLTIVFVFISGIVAAFLKGRQKDRCLKSFQGYKVHVPVSEEKEVFGFLEVESTGIELIYAEPHIDNQGHEENSFIIFRNEFPDMGIIKRYHDEMTVEQKNKRDKLLEKTWHPGFFKRFFRKIGNFFKTLKDSFMELLNLLIGQAKKMGTAGKVLSSQDKYIDRIKGEVTETLDTSYEPFFEKYIGRRVVAEVSQGSEQGEYQGVLKEYTIDFIELLDVEIKKTGEEASCKADIIVPRKKGTVRHAGEKIKDKLVNSEPVDSSRNS